MFRTLRYGLLTVALLTFLAACGAGPAAVQPTAEPTADTMADDTMAEPTADAMAEPTADTMAEPTADTMAEPTADTMAEPTADTMADDTMAEPTADAMAEPTADTMAEPTADTMADDAMAELPTWQTLPFADVRSGQQYTLADFAGRPVFVETMATWCPTCRSQLERVQAAATALEGQPPVFIALSVETTLPPEELARYADDNGFDMIFAITSPELLGALADSFGRTITNPPSTPHFVIAPDGSHGELMTGASSADAIVALLQAEAGEG